MMIKIQTEKFIFINEEEAIELLFHVLLNSLDDRWLVVCEHTVPIYSVKKLFNQYAEHLFLDIKKADFYFLKNKNVISLTCIGTIRTMGYLEKIHLSVGNNDSLMTTILDEKQTTKILLLL